MRLHSFTREKRENFQVWEIGGLHWYVPGRIVVRDGEAMENDAFRGAF
jgi:hypothetical protein